MDKRTQYARLKAMIERCDKKEITLTELQTLISMNIASNPKTVNNAMRFLGAAGLIKDIGSCRFKIIKENGEL